MFGHKKVKKEFAGNKFLAFGAAGEITVREAESFDLVDWEGPVILLYLRAVGYTSSWRLESVVPLNKKARRLMAKLIWKRDKSKYAEWREKYRKGTFPTFKKIKKWLSDLN